MRVTRVPVLRAPALLAALCLVGSVPGFAAPAAAMPDHELPFPCAEQWTGSTRSTHRPSAWSVDFNRAGDLGALMVSSAPGVVSRVADAGGSSYGRWIQVDHGDGYSSLYAHLEAQWVVPGQFVDQGAALGLVGESGGVTGAHLHFEERSGSSVTSPYFHGTKLAFGSTVSSANCPDVPLTGDWEGDGADEVAVFRRDPAVGTFELAADDGSVTVIGFGRGSDTPLAGDWDGDGRTEVGVRRARSRTFFLRTADGATVRTRFGLVRDVPVTGDWDGDGVDDLGVWRPGGARFLLRYADGTVHRVRLGTSSAQPVTGDWDGDGTDDLGVFDTATASFTLRTVTAEGVAGVVVVRFGSPADLPVSGDWDGDGVADVGTWAPGTATYSLRTPAPRRASRSVIRTFDFGRPRT